MDVHDVDRLRAAVDALLNDGEEAARRVLGPIGFDPSKAPYAKPAPHTARRARTVPVARRIRLPDPGPPMPRERVREATELRVWRRDHFCCRYCGQRTVFKPVLQVLGDLGKYAPPAGPLADLIPWTGNGSASDTHPLTMHVGVATDHIVSGTRGGGWTDEDNLVTACCACNMLKGDALPEELGWDDLVDARGDWDGLAPSFPALWRLLGRPKPGTLGVWARLLDADAAPRRDVRSTPRRWVRPRAHRLSGPSRATNRQAGEPRPPQSSRATSGDRTATGYDAWPIHSCHRTNNDALILAAALMGVRDTGNARGTLPTRTIRSKPPQSYATLDGHWYVEKPPACDHAEYHPTRRPWVLRRRPG